MGEELEMKLIAEYVENNLEVICEAKKMVLKTILSKVSSCNQTRRTETVEFMKRRYLKKQ